MNPILFEANERNFTTNGLGRLSDCIRCTGQEALNGIYELEIVYPVGGANYSLLEEHRVIYALHDDLRQPEPFEIYRISRPIDGKVTVNAWHVSYKLRKMVTKPFTATSAAEAVVLLPQNIIGANPFTFTTDKTSAGTLTVSVPMAVKTLMGGVQGSIIDVFGGEWQYHNYEVALKNRRGTDTSVKIVYGKNMTDVKKVSDASNIWDGILPYWTGTDSNGDDVTVVSTSVIWSSARNTFPYDMVIAVDASGAFETQPTQAQLAAWGTTYVNRNAKTQVPSSVTVSFVELWQTEEYKNIAPLERLHIGDSVTVSYPELGVETMARVVAYKYDVLTERYTEMTLGQVRASFASAVQATVEEATRDLPSKNYINQSVERATRMITGVTGGHVILHLNANGEPYEILIMDTDDIATAVNVIRLNAAGIGFSTTGYNGNYTTAWTIDGHFLADIIDTGTISANIINGGVLTLGGANNARGKIRFVNSSGGLYGEWGYKAFKVYASDPNYGSKTLAFRFEDAVAGQKIKKLSTAGITQESFSGSGIYYEASDGSEYYKDLVGFNSMSRKHWKYDFYHNAQGSLYGTTPANIASDHLIETYSNLDDATRYNEIRWYDGFEIVGGGDSSTYYLIYGGTNGFCWNPGMNNPPGRETTPGFLFDTNNGVFRVCLGTGFILTMRTSGSNSGLRYNNNAIATSSSKRYKHDITDEIDERLRAERLYDLKMKQFVYNDGEDQYCDTAGKTLPGFIAEDVEDIYPSAVIHKDGQVESWDERRIIPGMLDLIQKQKRQLDAQAERIKNMEERLEKIERAINDVF